MNYIHFCSVIVLLLITNLSDRIVKLEKVSEGSLNMEMSAQFYLENDPHKFTFVSCVGPNVHSMIIRPCESSKDCSYKQFPCTNSSSIQKQINFGEVAYTSCGHTGHCQLPIHYRTGMVICEMTNGHQIIDYFYLYPEESRTYELATSSLKFEVCHRNSKISQCLDTSQLNVSNYFGRANDTLTNVQILEGLSTERIECSTSSNSFIQQPQPQLIGILNDGSAINIDYEKRTTNAIVMDDGLIGIKDLKRISCNLQLHPHIPVIHHMITFDIKDPTISIGTKVSKEGQSEIDLRHVNSTLLCSFTNGSKSLDQFQRLYTNKEYDTSTKMSFGNFLKFVNIKSNQNNYLCHPLLSLPKPISPLDFYMDTPTPPSIMNKPSDGVIWLTSNSSQNIQCTFTGDPEPIVFWLQNGKKMLYCRGKSIQGEDDFTYQCKISLEISQFGCYSSREPPQLSCLVTNLFGSDILHYRFQNTRPCTKFSIFAYKSQLYFTVPKFHSNNVSNWSPIFCDNPLPTKYPEIVTTGRKLTPVMSYLLIIFTLLLLPLVVYILGVSLPFISGCRRMLRSTSDTTTNHLESVETLTDSHSLRPSAPPLHQLMTELSNPLVPTTRLWTFQPSVPAVTLRESPGSSSTPSSITTELRNDLGNPSSNSFNSHSQTLRNSSGFHDQISNPPPAYESPPPYELI